jgi:hypothetical protein
MVSTSTIRLQKQVVVCLLLHHLPPVSSQTLGWTTTWHIGRHWNRNQLNPATIGAKPSPSRATRPSQSLRGEGWIVRLIFTVVKPCKNHTTHLSFRFYSRNPLVHKTLY